MLCFPRDRDETSINSVLLGPRITLSTPYPARSLFRMKIADQWSDLRQAPHCSTKGPRRPWIQNVCILSYAWTAGVSWSDRSKVGEA